jgi:hypothetical protein
LVGIPLCTLFGLSFLPSSASTPFHFSCGGGVSCFVVGFSSFSYTCACVFALCVCVGLFLFVCLFVFFLDALFLSFLFRVELYNDSLNEIKMTPETKDDLVNFDRYHSLARIVQEVQHFQSAKYNNIEPIPELCGLLQNLPAPVN